GRQPTAQPLSTSGMGTNRRTRDVALAPSNAVAVSTGVVRGVPNRFRRTVASRQCATSFKLSTLLDMSGRPGLFWARDGQGPATAASVLGLHGDPATWIASPR